MGSVEKWKDGYRARWRDGQGRSQSKVFRFKADARAHLSRTQTDVMDGTYISAKDRRVTITEFVTGSGGWLESRPWRPQTVDQFRSQWRKQLEPKWGSRRLADIRPTEVQAWITSLSSGAAGRPPLSASYVEALYRRLVQILRAAAGDGLLAAPPNLSALKLPVDDRPADRVHVPTPEQVTAMADTMPERLAAMVRTAAVLGLRPGEAAGLTIERINFLKREVVIDRQLQSSVGRPPALAPPKTRAGVRTLPLPEDLARTLSAHIAAHPPLEVTVPEVVGGGTGRLLFLNRDRRPLYRSVLGSAWNIAAQKAGLPAELAGWHCLRHYGITRLIAAGVNPDYVRRFAGHASLIETLDTYAGWWPSDTDDARDVLTGALSGALSASGKEATR